MANNYFYKMANNRRRQNQIAMIKIGGVEYIDQAIMQHNIDDYFKNLMGQEGEHKFETK